MNITLWKDDYTNCGWYHLCLSLELIEKDSIKHQEIEQVTINNIEKMDIISE